MGVSCPIVLHCFAEARRSLASGVRVGPHLGTSWDLCLDCKLHEGRSVCHGISQNLAQFMAPLMFAD